MGREAPGEGIISKFTRDVGFYTLTAFIPAGVGLLGLVLFTRLFDATAYGRYSLALVFVTVCSTAAFGWLEQAVLRFEASDEEIIETVLTTTFLLSLGVVCLAAVGWVVVAPALGTLKSFYVAAAAAIVGTGSFQVCRGIFQARLESKRVTVYAAARAFLKLVAGLGIAVFVLNSIVGWLWGSAIGGIVGVLAMVGRLDTRRFVLKQSVVRRLARYGLPMIGWLFGMTLLTFVDRVLIELLVGSVAVGVYSSNYTLVQTGLPLVLSPLIQAAHPAIMSSWTGDNQEAVRELITEYSRYFLLLGVGATIFAGAISRPLSVLVLGQEFHPGYVIIPIVATALFLWNFAMLGHKGLELYEWTGTMTAGIAIAVFVNIVGNYLLIPMYGYVGAAFATLLSSSVYALFAYGTSFRTVHWRLPRRTMGHVAVAGTLMAGVGGTGYLLDAAPIVGPILSSIIGSVVYAGTLVAVGELDHKELLNPLKMLRKSG